MNMPIRFATTMSLLLGLPAFAVTTTWNGSVGDNDYSNGANWDNWTPTAADEAVINTGLAIHTGDLSRAGVTTLGGDGTLTINGRLQHASTGDATLHITGNATLNQTGNYFLVAHNANGVINQSGGTVNINLDRGFFISDGEGSQGTYNLTGGQLNVAMTSTSHSDFLGKRGANDLFYIDGGDATFSSANNGLRRYINQDAELRLDSGSVSFNGYQYFIIGRTGAGNPKVTINGGTFNANMDLAETGYATGFIVGAGGDNGQLDINGGSFNVTGSEMWIGDGNAKGVVNQTAGDVMIDGFALVLGRTAQETGDAYNMSGGTLTALDILRGDDATATFNFTGGVITLAGDETGILGESWFNASAGVTATYDADNDLTTIAVPEPGSLALLALGGLALARRRRRA